MLFWLSRDRIIQGSQQFPFKWEKAINLIYPELFHVCSSKLKLILHRAAKQQLQTNLIN